MFVWTSIHGCDVFLVLLIIVKLYNCSLTTISITFYIIMLRLVDRLWNLLHIINLKRAATPFLVYSTVNGCLEVEAILMFIFNLPSPWNDNKNTYHGKTTLRNKTLHDPKNFPTQLWSICEQMLYLWSCNI